MERKFDCSGDEHLPEFGAAKRDLNDTKDRKRLGFQILHSCFGATARKAAERAALAVGQIRKGRCSEKRKF
jgi:hypothetical protein